MNIFFCEVTVSEFYQLACFLIDLKVFFLKKKKVKVNPWTDAPKKTYTYKLSPRSMLVSIRETQIKASRYHLAPVTG